MSNRLKKVNSLLEHELSKMVAKNFKFQDALATLTHVDTTANLIEARAYISVMPEDRSEQIINILNGNVHDIQQKINKMLKMRPIPRISFVKDTQIASASKIEEILERLKKGEK